MEPDSAPDHASTGTRAPVRAAKELGWTSLAALGVMMTRTLAPCSLSRCTKSHALYAEMLPVTPRSTFLSFKPMMSPQGRQSRPPPVPEMKTEASTLPLSERGGYASHGQPGFPCDASLPRLRSIGFQASAGFHFLDDFKLAVLELLDGNRGRLFRQFDEAEIRLLVDETRFLGGHDHGFER